ncbi:MAG: S1 RNA-binding domain-containing protein, partial [Proteobacteria bacterium]|nr:S1 RNA-binding domain-containing protein [Pseudomonadota bacterium]
MTESFAELFEQSQSFLAKLKPGAIVIGTVVEVRGDVVVINAGLKSEGIVPIEQFRNDAGEIDVAEGDQVKVALDSIENGFGETVLSREKAKRAMVWDELEEALENNETITGRISGKVKGGFTVDIKDVRGFLPGSLVDVRPVRDSTYLEGKELEFKLIKLDRKRNNIVVSRRAVVESEHSEEREQLMEKLVEGAIVLCRRGAIARVGKSLAVLQAGGVGMVMYENSDAGDRFTDNHHVPSVHVDNSEGLAIKAYIASLPPRGAKAA